MNINIQLQIQLQHPLIPIVVNKQNNQWIEWIKIINSSLEREEKWFLKLL